MRALIYGFGPYRQFADNITEKIVRALPRQRGVAKVVFPVRFNKRQFIEAIEKFRPDLIIGLGQCSRGRILRIERRAVNHRRDSRWDQSTPILRGRPLQAPTNLELKLGRFARLSKDAGDYVCNFSMYVMLNYINERKLPALYGFIHIPRRYDPKMAVRVLRQALVNAACRPGRSTRSNRSTRHSRRSISRAER